MHRQLLLTLGVFLVAVALTSGTALADHLGPTSSELDVVGHFPVPIDGLTTDVWAFGNYAYLGSFDEPKCSLDLTGVRVIDISDPANPTLAAFIPAAPGTRNNDVKVAHIETPYFQGEILVASNEPCGSVFNPRLQATGAANIPGQGGVNIYDVTNPTKPRALKQNFLGFGVHNTFIYQQGDKAFLLVVDDDNQRDFHIVDITKPHSPKEIVAVGAPDWPDLVDNIGVGQAFLHDVWAQENNGRVIAYLSYWDAGLVLLDITDPAHPIFLGDSDYLRPDPVSGEPPEGNSHVAVPTTDGTLVFMGDEDFSPYRSVFTVDTGAFAGQYPAVEAAFTQAIGELPDNEMDGPTTFVGRACHTSPPIPAPQGSLTPGAEEEFIAVIERGDCRFDEKIQNVANAGYGGAVVFNAAPLADQLVQMAGDPNLGTIPALFVTRFTGFAILGISPTSPPETPLPPIGTQGEKVTAAIVFDGWGYGRILDVTDPTNIVELGQYATEGVLSQPVPPGDRTMHNVIVRDRTAYLSWYADGMRVVDFSSCVAGGGVNSCSPAEVAHFIADSPEGSNFWGVYLHDHPNGNTYILGSDRDTGLWIFSPPAGVGTQRVYTQIQIYLPVLKR